MMERWGLQTPIEVSIFQLVKHVVETVMPLMVNCRGIAEAHGGTIVVGDRLAVAAAGPPMQTYVYSPTIALDGSGHLIAAWVHLENSMEYINLPGNVVTTAIAVARYQP